MVRSQVNVTKVRTTNLTHTSISQVNVTKKNATLNKEIKENCEVLNKHKEQIAQKNKLVNELKKES